MSWMRKPLLEQAEEEEIQMTYMLTELQRQKGILNIRVMRKIKFRCKRHKINRMLIEKHGINKETS